MYLFFDAETVGLYGPPFAYGYVLTTALGETVDEGVGVVPYEMMLPKGDGRAKLHDAEEWLKRHCLPALPYPTIHHDADFYYRLATLFDGAKRRSEEENDGSLLVVTDCAYPVETGVFREVAARHKGSFQPYPLLDLSTLLHARGYDPVAAYPREPGESPPHNPLCDARQTCRIWHQLMRGEGPYLNGRTEA